MRFTSDTVQPLQLPKQQTTGKTRRKQKRSKSVPWREVFSVRFIHSFIRSCCVVQLYIFYGHKTQDARKLTVHKLRSENNGNNSNSNSNSKRTTRQPNTTINGVAGYRNLPAATSCSIIQATSDRGGCENSHAGRRTATTTTTTTTARERKKTAHKCRPGVAPPRSTVPRHRRLFSSSLISL